MKTMLQRCPRFAGGLLGTLAAFVLAFALTLAPLTARAQQATNGQNGGSAGGISSGKNGANGSDGVLFVGVSSVAGGTFTAGSGGNGGSGGNSIFGGSPTSGGGGGNGGNAAVAQAGSTVTVTGGTFTAGGGGNGGGGASLGGNGGGGGSGGSALVALAGSTITVTGGTFSVGQNGASGGRGPIRGGAGGPAGYDLFANGGAITVYGYNFSAGPALTGSGTFTATIGGVTQTLSYSVSPAAGSAIVLKNLGTPATTTAPNSSPNPSVAGQPVTLTAVVTPGDPTLGTPTGSVTFQVGSTFLSPVPLVNGTAAITTNALPLGSDTLTAYYSGDSSFAGSSGSFVQTVNSVTQTTLTPSLNPSVLGRSVTFTAAVSAVSPGTGTPTGTVQFAVDGVNVGGPIRLDSSGQATDTEAGLTLGTHSVTVTYAPTGLFLGNAGASLTQTVNPHVSPQYVTPSGSDSSDGSQASPKQTLQAAINATLSGDTVIVEDGTYSGAGNCDIDFAGRNITVRSASGDATRTIIDCGGSASSLHRGFTFQSGEKNAVVSGLTIQNGYESTNQGGAVAVSRSTVTLTNCALIGNSASSGGGVYNTGGTVTLTNCTLTGNTATTGGGVCNTSSRPTGLPIIIVGTMTLTNCTLTGNSATSGGGGVYNSGTVALTNDILYGDGGGEISGAATASHCDVQGGFTGTGDINADPLFVNAAAGDFHLRPGSPCLGAGTSAGAPATDRDGTLRPSHPSIGAYDRVAGHTHLLWNNTDGRVMLWSVAPDGSFTLHGFGPYTDNAPQNVWHATAVATGADGVSHLLWNNTDGRVMLWTVDDQGNFTYSGYGPYTDGAAQNKWSATAVSVGPDGIVHLLWNNTDHRVMLWNVAPDFTFTLAGYGPYTDDYVSRDPGNLWSAAALATGPDNVSRIVWNNADGRVMLWDADSSFNFTLAGYGPYTDGAPQNLWSAVGVSVGPDNLTHLLWSNTDRRAMFWDVDSAFGFTLAGYGPYTDDAPQNLWSAQALATGPDGLSHLLWANTDDRAMLWGVDNSFNFTVAGYGPYTDNAPQNLWRATAVSAGL